MTDASGNVIKLKGLKKKLFKKEEKATVKRIKAKLKNGEDLDSAEEEFAIEGIFFKFLFSSIQKKFFFYETSICLLSDATVCYTICSFNLHVQT